MTGAPGLLACHDCDLLQRRPVLAPGMLAQCPRCGAVLQRKSKDDRVRQLALVLTCCVLFVLANAFPIISLDAHGQTISASLLTAIGVMWDNEAHFVALLVLLTTFVLPAAEIGLMLGVLLQPQPRPWMLRIMATSRPWAMIDVFVLGLLVSIRKLADMATMMPGEAFWSLCILMLILAAVRGNFHLHDYWARTPLRHG